MSELNKSFHDRTSLKVTMVLLICMYRIWSNERPGRSFNFVTDNSKEAALIKYFAKNVDTINAFT